jgi:hypothetical protein
MKTPNPLFTLVSEKDMVPPLRQNKNAQFFELFFWVERSEEESFF